MVVRIVELLTVR